MNVSKVANNLNKYYSYRWSLDLCWQRLTQCAKWRVGNPKFIFKHLLAKLLCSTRSCHVDRPTRLEYSSSGCYGCTKEISMSCIYHEKTISFLNEWVGNRECITFGLPEPIEWISHFLSCGKFLMLGYIAKAIASKEGMNTAVQSHRLSYILIPFSAWHCQHICQLEILVCCKWKRSYIAIIISIC